MVEVGDRVPEFCLPDSAGEDVCVASLEGKWVVVYIYPKDNTPGCTVEAREFSELKKEFEREGAVVLGISPDSCESHTEFIIKKDLTVTLLSDSDHRVIEQFGSWGTKKMFGKTFQGAVRSTFLVNPEGKIAHKWPKVRAKGHAKDVLETLKRLK